MMSKPKPDPESIYVCAQAFIADALGVALGERLRGNSRAVLEHFERFVPDGVPPSEWPNPYAGIRYADAEPPRNPPREIPANRRVRARRGFTAFVKGRHHVVQRGQLFDRRDTIVKKLPSEFETVPQPIEADAVA
jgi:hypothetical protein